ncbi:MAG: DUF4760 domain-containing protein [Bryobacteraceae bacterium]
MSHPATYDDVTLILRLYDMRRDAKMREARIWFVKSFKVKNLEQLNSLCPPGSDGHTYYRMVTSYWEMVASFITAGVLNEELFFQSGRELLLVWERIKDVVPEARDAYKDPSAMKNLETVATNYIQWLNRQSPEAYSAFSARVSG